MPNFRGKLRQSRILFQLLYVHLFQTLSYCKYTNDLYIQFYNYKFLIFFKDCPNEASAFNRNTGKCDLPHNVPGCGRPFSCPPSDGSYVNPASCYSYYQCLRGASTLIECPVMNRMTGQKMAFNRASASCDNPVNVPGCGTPYIPILLSSTPPPAKPQQSAPNPANSINPSVPVNRAPRAPMFCPFAEGNFANPDSCFSYFKCIKGSPSLIVSFIFCLIGLLLIELNYLYRNVQLSIYSPE